MLLSSAAAADSTGRRPLRPSPKRSCARSRSTIKTRCDGPQAWNDAVGHQRCQRPLGALASRSLMHSTQAESTAGTSFSSRRITLPGSGSHSPSGGDRASGSGRVARAWRATTAFGTSDTSRGGDEKLAWAVRRWMAYTSPAGSAFQSAGIRSRTIPLRRSPPVPSSTPKGRRLPSLARYSQASGAGGGTPGAASGDHCGAIDAAVRNRRKRPNHAFAPPCAGGSSRDSSMRTLADSPPAGNSLNTRPCSRSALCSRSPTQSRKPLGLTFSSVRGVPVE